MAGDLIGDLMTSGDLVVGTHLSPVRCFGERLEPDERHEALRVVRTVALPLTENEEIEVFITRASGLFVRPPPDLVVDWDRMDKAIFEAKLRFHEQLATAFNLLVCALAIQGVISEPASPLGMSAGRLWEGFATVIQPREGAYERTIGPFLQILTDAAGPFFWPPTPLEVLDQADAFASTKKLALVSPVLPTFVAAAYSLYSRRLLAEALLDAWIVVEQVLHHLWVLHVVGTALDSRHRDRLTDYRSFTTNVQAEVLFVKGVLPPSAYGAIQIARKRRNDLAHGGTVSVATASEALVAMQTAIDLATGFQAADAALRDSLNW